VGPSISALFERQQNMNEPILWMSSPPKKSTAVVGVSEAVLKAAKPNVIYGRGFQYRPSVIKRTQILTDMARRSSQQCGTTQSQTEHPSQEYGSKVSRR
jgi:hypothetical protein